MSLIYRDDLIKWEELFSGLIAIASDISEDRDEEKIKEFKILLREKYMELVSDGSLRPLDHIEIIAYMYAVCVGLSAKVRLLNLRFNELIGNNGQDITLNQVLALADMILTPDEINPGNLFVKESILNRFLIQGKYGEADMSLLNREIILRSDVAAALMGSPYPLDNAGFAVTVYAEDDIDELIAGREEADELAHIYDSMDYFSERGVIFIGGDKGVGRTFITRNMARDRKSELLVLDASVIESLDAGDINNILGRVIAKTIFDDAVLYVRFSTNDLADIKKQTLILKLIMDMLPLVIVSGSDNLADEILHTETVHIIKKPAPDKSKQKEFFKYFADEFSVEYAEDVDLNEIISLFNLTPDKILKAVNCAQSVTDNTDGKYIVNSSTLKTEIRKLCTVKFDKLATKLESSFKWDDIELSELSATKITEAMNRIRFKSVVNDEYGFERSLPYGRGLTIALFGPPGTGKTMAANIIANELGMDIYRIDLSQISSKYIGESEKNLGAVFEAARYSNAILFFDEADALFSKRTDVSSSNDKHANTETAYLLQKMEEYPGVCILATNVIANFDAAFKRRITYMIPVEKLSEEMRYNLWLKVFPKNTPLDDNLYFDHYARLAELSGSGIKSAALSAAYRAAARGDKVTHSDLCEAIDEEYKKAGHTSILPSLMSLSSV